MFAHESIVIKHFETICSVDQGTAINPKVEAALRIVKNAMEARENTNAILFTRWHHVSPPSQEFCGLRSKSRRSRRSKTWCAFMRITSWGQICARPWAGFSAGAAHSFLPAGYWP